MSEPPTVDLLLSSGFLAFGRHAGFLQGVEAAGHLPRRVFGTSSGALVGALWCAGLTPEGILSEVKRQRPIDRMRFTFQPWRGIFSLEPMIAQIAELLPPTFEELERPLAVGVRDSQGRFRFVDAGPLPPAVAASCAIPFVFAPIALTLDGQAHVCADGGAVDRLGYAAWRSRPDRSEQAWVHLVERSAGAVGTDDLSGAVVVRSGRSGAGFWSLGDIEGRAAETRATTLDSLT